MNKVLKILALLGLLVLLFSGCQNSENELKNRLIVQAIGIDAQKDGTVLVTLQTLNTEMAGNPNSGASLGDVVTSFQVTGKTVADAISNAATMIGKKPLLSQNRLVVFGRDTAEQGILEHLDFLSAILRTAQPFCWRFRIQPPMTWSAQKWAKMC